MKFRPCIDIHNGRVKQIVGGSLKDSGDQAKENFVAGYPASYYAELYKDLELDGGHIILLNGKDSEYYEKTRAEALSALRAYPGGMMIGGGIRPENAWDYLDAGASHVIVTSYVFSEGRIHYDKLEEMKETVGKERLVIDLSCRKKLVDGSEKYYVVTDRWQKFTEQELTAELLRDMSAYCDELLVHAVDVEGKAGGIELPVVRLLAEKDIVTPTYAGGISSMEDIETIYYEGQGRVDFTIGSALDIFGGHMNLEEIIKFVFF